MKSIAEDRVEIANAAGVVLFTAEHRGPVTVEMFDRFGRLLTVDQKGSVSIRILPSALPTIIQRGALSAQFTPDGRVLVVVPRAVAFRDADTGCLLPGRIPAHGRNNTIEEVVVSADSTLAAVHESDGRASVYDTRSGRLIGALGYSAITRDGLTAISKSIAKRSLALQSASRD